MDTKPLGKSGVSIPEIGYGTYNYRGDAATIHRALELGANLIDSAESYGTEDDVGRVIAGNRNAYFLATKVSPSHFRYEEVLAAAEASLLRLGVDTIDLYQLHWPNYNVPIEETMRAVDRLVADGKVRFVGVSNFSTKLLEEAELALGSGHVVSNQIKFSLFDHEFADEVLPYCRERGVTVLAYSSLEQGALAARVKERPQLRKLLDEIASDTGKTHAQIALNWVVSEPIAVTIPMTNQVSRVDENCGASGWRLTDAQYTALTEAAGAGKTRRWWVS